MSCVVSVCSIDSDSMFVRQMEIHHCSLSVLNKPSEETLEAGIN